MFYKRKIWVYNQREPQIDTICDNLCDCSVYNQREPQIDTICDNLCDCSVYNQREPQIDTICDNLCDCSVYNQREPQIDTICDNLCDCSVYNQREPQIDTICDNLCSAVARSKLFGGATCAAGKKNWCLCGGSLDCWNCLCQFWFYHYVALLFWFFAGQKTENAYMDVKWWYTSCLSIQFPWLGRWRYA